MKTKLLTALVTATLKTLLLYQEKSHIFYFQKAHYKKKLRLLVGSSLDPTFANVLLCFMKRYG